MNCDERIEQLSALLDNELSLAEFDEVSRHLLDCPVCARRLAEFSTLRATLLHAVPEEDISTAFLARIEAGLEAEARPVVQKGAPVLPFKRRRHVLRGFAMGTVAAMAAMVLFISLKPPSKLVELAAVRDAALRGTSALSGVRGITDAPSIAGFNLTGARGDIVAGHAAEVLTYAQARASVTLCIWKANGEPAHAPREGSYHGMNIVYWNDGFDEYWAVAEQPMQAVEAFAGLARNRQS